MDDQSLLAAIQDAPDDDGPRLVYADLLQQRNDPRGELIAVQCALAAEPTSARTPRMRKREAELLRDYERAWVAELGLPVLAAKFERGFIVEAVVLGAEVAKSGFALGALPHPRWRLERVTLEEMLTISPKPEMARVRAISISGTDGDMIVKALAASPHLAGLRSLALQFHRLAAKSVRVLERAPALSKLVELDLDRCPLDDEVGPHLADLVERGFLHSVSLRKNQIGPVAASAIARASGKLSRMNLSGNQLTDEGAAQIAAAPGSASLASLVLFANHIELEGARAIATSEHLDRLQCLDLGGNDIGDEGARALANRRGLRQLRLAHATIGDDGARALLERSEDLELLDLRGNCIGEETRKALVARWGAHVRLDPVLPGVAQ